MAKPVSANLLTATWEILFLIVTAILRPIFCNQATQTGKRQREGCSLVVLMGWGYGITKNELKYSSQNAPSLSATTKHHKFNQAI